ncbi:diguanylate cyclase domain-containing protein [Paucibacter soli]|uniref:diguanylate cyclase domain-containing protein n=1 Tax=Paucibacter soli TaxID=3133433 RepID=UPI0030A05443
MQQSQVQMDRGSGDVLVLLVDDQPIIGEAIRRMLLEQPDIGFHYCQDAAQAQAQAELLRPSVILQDLVLPGVDGLSLVRGYRSQPRTRDVPVIVLSSREEAGTKRDSFNAGANDYLVKLPDPIELVARIRLHSRSYQHQLQRDEAYRALRESQQQLVDANLALERLSRVDGLTGLANRRTFDTQLDLEWRRAQREQCPLGLLMIDIDDFKAYNDGYGHQAGDEALKAVAGALEKAAQRAADLPARYGGEEFAIILPHTSLEGVQQRGQHVIDGVAALQMPHRGSLGYGRVSVSVGAAVLMPTADIAPRELIAAADQALYEAKHAGKNRVVLKQPSASEQR